MIGPGLKVLFCGINPGLYSAATGFHFARPGNRFWPALHAAGFTPRLFHPSENERLLELGYGLTNLVNRATAAADELSPAELVAGGEILAAKVRRFRPGVVAFVGRVPECFRSAQGDAWPASRAPGRCRGVGPPQSERLERELPVARARQTVKWPPKTF